MLYLLIAVVLCLLVPWLPWLVYRRLPRGPLPPLAQGQLHQLAEALQGGAPLEEVAALPAEEKQTRTDVTLPEGSMLTAGAEQRDQPEGAAEPGRGKESDSAPVRSASAPLRLTFPSYWWVNIVLVAIMMPGMYLLGAGWAVLFHYLGEEHARTFEPVLFLFKPFSYGIVCVLPAFMLGICSSMLLALLCTRLLLGRSRFREALSWMEGYVNARSGGSLDRDTRVLAVFAVCVSALSTLYVWQVMNWYLRFGEDQIAIKRLLGSGEEVYSYADVDQVVLTTWPKEQLHLRFRNGRTWETDDTFHMPQGPERARLLDLLQGKTGKPIIHARLITDVPGW